MYHLIIVFCLITSPEECRVVNAGLGDEMPKGVCEVLAQPMAIMWLNDHPAWQLRRWICDPKPLEEPA